MYLDDKFAGFIDLGMHKYVQYLECFENLWIWRVICGYSCFVSLTNDTIMISSALSQYH